MHRSNEIQASSMGASAKPVATQKQRFNLLFRALRSVPGMIVIATLTACATAPKENALQLPPLEKLMENADQAVASGDREAALKQLAQAATANPTSAKPWVKTAQMEFDAGNYPAAIQAADEAMKRDSSSREAKALAVVASLRVAVQALADIRKDIQLSGSTRSEAEQLARSLRDTLGQEVLVPLLIDKPNTPARRNTSSAPRPSPRPGPAASPSNTASPASVANPSDVIPRAAPTKPKVDVPKTSGGDDPFGALR